MYNMYSILLFAFTEYRIVLYIEAIYINREVLRQHKSAPIDTLWIKENKKSSKERGKLPAS
jgi:hypothetical protein